jgi:hypothetical protein
MPAPMILLMIIKARGHFLYPAEGQAGPQALAIPHLKQSQYQQLSAFAVNGVPGSFLVAL